MVKKVDKDVGKKIRRIKNVKFLVYPKSKIKRKLGINALRFSEKNKVLVADMPDHMKKRGFVGYRSTKARVEGKNKTAIFLSDKLGSNESKVTFWHEAGHHKAKRALTPSIRKKLSKEAKGTKIYNELKSQGYTAKQIPEELLVERFANHKTGRKVIISGEKFPTFKKQFNNLIKRA